MIAIGFIIETVVEEFLFTVLFCFSIAELFTALKPHNVKKVKIFQTLVILGTLILSFFGIIVVIDWRSVYGIYTHTYPEYWIPLSLIISIIPMLCFGVVWIEQMYITVCKAMHKSGPFEIMTRPKLLRNITLGTIGFFIVCDVVTALLVIVTDRLSYAAFLFGPVAALSAVSTYITLECKKLTESFEKNPIPLGSQKVSLIDKAPMFIETRSFASSLWGKSSSRTSEKEKSLDSKSYDPDAQRRRQRQVVSFQISVGYSLSIAILIVCAFGFCYSVSPLGLNERVSEFIHSDPSNFQISGVVYSAKVALLTTMSISLMNLGFLCKRQTFEEMDVINE
jgi:hypothetical protein